jgi:hypothetical protein
MTAPVVVVAMADRTRRLELAATLATAGLSARTVSRLAELAKLLRDTTVRLVVTSDSADDAALAAALAAALPAAPVAVPWRLLAATDTGDVHLAQIQDALADEASASERPGAGDGRADEATSSE